MDTNRSPRHVPWNKRKIVGQKARFKLKEVWAIRMRLRLAGQIRELAMFDLQQASCVRSDAAASERYLPQRSHRRANHRHATEDEASSPIRDHGSDQGRRRGVDHGEEFKVG